MSPLTPSPQVDEIQQVGLTHFHFSLNWSALVPTGDTSQANATLLGYYRCFCRQLLRANVTPVVTLWHHTRQRSSNNLPAPLDAGDKWLSRSGWVHEEPPLSFKSRVVI